MEATIISVFLFVSPDIHVTVINQLFCFKHDKDLDELVHHNDKQADTKVNHCRSDSIDRFLFSSDFQNIK